MAAHVAEADFHYLDAPIVRIAAKDAPIPFGDVLERAVLPQTSDSVASARALVRDQA